MAIVAKNIDLSRVVIENVRPEIDGGRFAVKRTVGERVVVEADVFADGHDELGVTLFYRVEADKVWRETPMRLLGNDHWQGEFVIEEQKPYVYKVEGWVDRFATWKRDLQKWIEGGQDIEQELLVGAELIAAASGNANGDEAKWLLRRAEGLAKEWPQAVRSEMALEEDLAEQMRRFESREPKTVHDVGQRIWVDRERARFSAWYELFPRSTSDDQEKAGTFKTTMQRLAYIEELGFDVLYLPPIHPIGLTHRKGRNNNPAGEDGAPGSPWAIGSKDGGHDAINPDLGTLEDFRALVKAANDRGIDVAMDLALQCSPDHPWVKEHPSWFRHRPDGSIRYAENPPKRYEDIYPIDFETEDWQGLWAEVDRVVRHWVAQGVRVFRVDNPHTKAFAFWQWLIAGVQKDYPDVLFLAEAFTRPRTMYRLAKLGFSQSYTYFTWRTSKWDFTQYATELFNTEVREYFRPNFWPNTPDILHEYLQHGGRPAFFIRLLLASTLSANYGIYGPAFELGANTPREPGSEEYLDSEKYEVRHWDLAASHSLRDVIARVNWARRENAALQYNSGFSLLEVTNDNLLAYSKVSPDGANRIVCVVNLDPYSTQAGNVRIPRGEWGLQPGAPAELLDLIDGGRYHWADEWNYVELNPHVLPGHLLRLQSIERPAGGQAERTR